MADLHNYTCYQVFQYITEVNASRVLGWHGVADKWSLLEWAGAMCGEAGEVANIAKKIRRVELGINPEAKGGNSEGNLAQFKIALGEEIADTFIYLNLLAHEAGIDMYDAIQTKFNAVSIRDGHPERLLGYPPLPRDIVTSSEPQES
jgi:NTP pyrophosphatase (non-canonical NTP hydrolase)